MAPAPRQILKNAELSLVPFPKLISTVQKNFRRHATDPIEKASNVLGIDTFLAAITSSELGLSLVQIDDLAQVTLDLWQ